MLVEQKKWLRIKISLVHTNDPSMKYSFIRFESTLNLNSEVEEICHAYLKPVWSIVLRKIAEFWTFLCDSTFWKYIISGPF